MVFIFWVVVSIFYANSLLQKNNSNSLGNNQNTNNSQKNIFTLTTAMVAQHNTASDCWVTASNNVYNVTSYIRSHPGGQVNITKYCGVDIAAAFVAQGHSVNASNIFASYKIGTIGSTISTDAIATPPPTNTNQNNVDSQSDEGEEDDD